MVALAIQIIFQTLFLFVFVDHSIQEKVLILV